MGAKIRNGKFYDDVRGTGLIIVIGYNDPIAVSQGLTDRAGNLYRNQMVPGSMSTGTTNGILDIQTICPASSDYEYGYRLGLMVVWYYGGNALRVGAQDSDSTSKMVHAYASNPAVWKQRLVDFVNGAWMAGCYTILQLAGGADAGSLAGPHTINKDTWQYVLPSSGGNLMQGDLFTLGSEAHNWFYGTYAVDVGNALNACPGFLYLDLFNEADHDYMVEKYWSKYGNNSPTGPRMTAVKSWAKGTSDKVVSAGYTGNVGIGFACEGSIWNPDWYTGHWCMDPQNFPNIHVLNYHAYSNMDAGLNDPTNQTKKRWYWQQIKNFLSSLNKPVIMSEWGLQGPINGFSDVYYEPYRELLSLLGYDGYLCMRLQGLAEFPHALPNPWPTTPAFTTSVGGNTGGSGSSGGSGDTVTIGGTTYTLDSLDSSLLVGSPAYAEACSKIYRIAGVKTSGGSSYDVLILKQ